MSERPLLPSHPRALDDLATYLSRAHRADPDGAARLQALDLGGRWVLAVTVCPIGSGAGLPVALGMRVLALEDAADVDATVPLGALLDRLARDRAALPVPPVRVLTAAWAGVSAPRGGWVPVAPIGAAVLREAAAHGAQQVSRGADRAAVWSAPLVSSPGVPGPGVPDHGAQDAPPASAGAPGPPAAAALTADVLGFLIGAGSTGGADDSADAVAVARSGPWWRLSTAGGHVLARPPSPLSRG